LAQACRVAQIRCPHQAIPSVNLSSAMASASLALTVIAISSSVADAHALASRSDAFLHLLERSHSDMRPDRVAHTLIGVEDNWHSQALTFASCTAEAAKDGAGAAGCDGSKDSFVTSCSKVSSAVVHSSSGDRADVVDYMQDVCSQAELQGWHRARCSEFSSGLTDALTNDGYTNRESFDPHAFCTTFWQRIVSEEVSKVKTREHQEAQQKAEAAKRLADEAAAKYALMKQAHLDAKAEVARHSDSPKNATTPNVTTAVLATANTSATPLAAAAMGNATRVEVNTTSANASMAGK